MFYIKSTFKFSKQASQYIINFYLKVFENYFIHDLMDNLPRNFFITPPGKELREYFLKLNIIDKIDKVQVFVSNSKNWYKGNPHLDLTWNNPPKIIKSRFNILILGDPFDKMHWWGHMNTIDQLTIQEFTYLNGSKYKSYAVPGTTVENRWEYLAEPTLSVANLILGSAFVKTNCVHTVNVSPGPRLILTVLLKDSIENIFDDKITEIL